MRGEGDRHGVILGYVGKGIARYGSLGGSVHRHVLYGISLLGSDGEGLIASGSHRNIFAERFWRSLKYEWLYLNDYEHVRDLSRDLREYLRFYNTERLHSSLGYRTPEEVYFENRSPNVSCRKEKRLQGLKSLRRKNKRLTGKAKKAYPPGEEYEETGKRAPDFQG